MLHNSISAYKRDYLSKSDYFSESKAREKPVETGPIFGL